MLGLVIETGADDCSAVLIFLILSLKKCPKELEIMVEDLCRIFLKVFHRALGIPLFSAMTVE